MLFNLCAGSIASILVIGATSVDALAATCKAFPGDKSWPTKAVWDSFNSTVGGQLIATVPIGSPCHDPTFDEAKCSALKAAWTDPFTQ
jgi:hypothetical protein